MEYRKLGDICDVVSGGTPSRSKPEYWDGDIPWIKIGNIKGKYVSEADEFITEEGLAGSSAKMLSKGTILYTIFATLGEAGVLTIDACTNQAIAGITIKNDDIIDRDYLYYYLKSKKNYVNDIGRGVAQNNINMSILRGFEVPIREIFEQQTITDILDKIGKIIDLRKEELDRFDELIKARFVELFGRLEDNKYPSARLGDYAKLQGGFAFKSKDFVADGIPLVQIGNVNKDYLDWNVVNAVPEDYLDKYREFSLMKDDLVMAMTRPIIKSLGSVKVAKVAETDLPCLLNQRVGRFQINDKLHPVFLEALCKTDDFKDYVERMSGNSLQPNISSKQVEDYNIIIPPEALQEQFAKFVKQVDKSKVAVQKALDEAQLLFDSLMQDYFG